MVFSEATNRIDNQEDASSLHAIVLEQGRSVEVPHQGGSLSVETRHSKRRGNDLTIHQGERSIKVRKGQKSPWQFDGSTGWNRRSWSGGPTKAQVDRLIHDTKGSVAAALRKR